MPVEHSPRRANPGKLLLPFIPRQMDDAGLTPAQFRLVCRVARRGVCTESIPKIAAGCRLAIGTVKKVLPFLVASNVLAKEKRSGQTSVFKVIPPEEWQVEPRPKGNLGQKTAQHPKQTDTEANSHPSHSDQKTAHKGNPIKAIPTRGNSPGLEKRDGGLITKDRERIQKQIREEREKNNPDKDIIAGLKSELTTINAELSRRGKLAGQSVPHADSPNRPQAALRPTPAPSSQLQRFEHSPQLAAKFRAGVQGFFHNENQPHPAGAS